LLDDGISRSEISNGDYEYYSFEHDNQNVRFNLAAGKRGTQESHLEKVSILNAKDLKDVSFACYQNSNNVFTALAYKFDESSKVLTLSPKTNTKVNEIISVHYGKPGDSNVCEGF